MSERLDKAGLAYFWNKVKALFVEKGVTSSTSIPAGSGMTVVTGSYQPTVRRQGNIVIVEGAMRNTNARTSNAAFTVGTIPVGYRPSQTVYRIQRCGTASKPRTYNLVINTSGTIQCGAILDPSSADAATANAQEAFYLGCSYVVADSASSASETMGNAEIM